MEATSPAAQRPAPRPVRGISRAGWAVLATAAVVIVTIAVFDWTWFRPLIQQHVQERSGRRIDFDAMEVGLNRSLQPSVRLQNLDIQNAPWADPRPLVRAREFAFSVTWDSLWGERITVPRLVMVDAELDLERQADGLRNWRLTRPEDRGPGKVRVLAVEATRLRARVVHRGIDLALNLASEPLVAPRALPGHAGADGRLTKTLRAHGTRGGMRFDVDGDVGDAVTFYDTGDKFAVDARLRTPQAGISVQGLAQDLAQLGGLDVQAHASGNHVEELARLFGRRWQLAPLAVDIDAHAVKQGERWRADTLTARVGNSDLAGSAEWRQPAGSDGSQRPALRAALRSQRLDLAELARVAGVPARSGDPQRLDALLQQLDADVTLAVAKVEGLPVGPIGALNTHATLDAGRLDVTPLALTLAGGKVAGRLTIDTARSPAAGGLEASFDGLGTSRLLAGSRRADALDGQLDAAIDLEGHGNTLAELTRSASGSVKAKLLRATIPLDAEAKLALDLGGWLRSRVRPGERTAVTCAMLELGLDRGKGTIRRFAFETDRVAVAARGGLDLDRGQVDMVLTPQRKRIALLARDKSIRLAGRFDDLHTRLVDIADPPGDSRAMPDKTCDNARLSSH